MRNLPKWMRKLTAAQRKHIRETTKRSTLAEVRANVANSPCQCYECLEILRKVES